MDLSVLLQGLYLANFSKYLILAESVKVVKKATVLQQRNGVRSITLLCARQHMEQCCSFSVSFWLQTK